MFRSYKSPKTFLLAKCKLYYNWSYLKIVRGTATRSIGRRYKALQKVEPNLFFIFTVVFVVGAGVSFVVGWFVLFLVFRCFHQISFFFTWQISCWHLLIFQLQLRPVKAVVVEGKSGLMEIKEVFINRHMNGNVDWGLILILNNYLMII